MKVDVRREEPARAVLEIEVPPEQVDQAIARASQRLAERVRVPGFRPGKAPRTVLERHVGKDAIYEEALDVLLPEVYRQAVEEAQIRPIARPTFDVKTMGDGEPLRFAATVDLQPEVTLGPYQELRVETPSLPDVDQEVARGLQDLRERHATLTAVDEPAQRGDFVRLTVTGEAAGLDRFRQGKEYLVEAGGGMLPAEAEEALIGAAAGQDRNLPAGNEGARLVVHVDEVRRRRLPELDDAFARIVSNKDTFAELRDDLRARAASEAEDGARRELQDRALRALVERSQVALPQSLVDHEAEHVLEEFEERLQRRGLTLETYLRHSEKTLDDVRGEARKGAEERLRNDLVLDRFADAEGIEPTEQEIENEEENLAAGLRQDRARIREWLAEGDRAAALRRSLRRRKGLQRLVEIAAGGQEG